MGCGESKSDAVDASDVRLEEASTALGAELERIEREGAVRLRQAQELVDSNIAQCKATGEQRLREEEARIRTTLSQAVSAGQAASAGAEGAEGATRAPQLKKKNSRLADLIVRASAADSATRLADLVAHAKVTTSSADPAAEARTRHTKFAESAFTLAYTGRSAFFGGLEGRVGQPSPNLRAAMQTEHCAEADSQDEFTTANYGVVTTPEVEWHAVIDPVAGLVHLKRTAYPVETCGLEAGGDNRRRGAASLKPLRAFAAELAHVNAELQKLREATLLEEELLAGRLYTGPMVRRRHHRPLPLAPRPSPLLTARVTPVPDSTKSTTSSAAPPSTRRRSSSRTTLNAAAKATATPRRCTCSIVWWSSALSSPRRLACTAARRVVCCPPPFGSLTPTACAAASRPASCRRPLTATWRRATQRAGGEGLRMARARRR